MSEKQAANFKILKRIFKELREFGLNPHEWRFERVFNEKHGKTVIRLHHKEDRNFRLSGTIRGRINPDQEGAWMQDLRIVSL